MNNNIKMKKKNADGVLIIKEVEPALYSNYIALGWEEVKPEPKKNIFDKKIDKEKDEK
jgi:hypothetical protein